MYNHYFYKHVRNQFASNTNPTYDEIEQAVIAKLGGAEQFIPIFPADLNQLRDTAKTDPNFHAIPLPKWDNACGFDPKATNAYARVQNVIDPNNLLQTRIRDVFHTNCPAAPLVSLLKTAAYLVVKPFLNNDLPIKTQVLCIDDNRLNQIEADLKRTENDKVFLDRYSRYETKSWTADFKDGMEMDIQFCAGDIRNAEGNPLWTQAVLFDHGSEIGSTDPSDTLLGMWDIMDEHAIYITYAMPAETI